MVLRLTLLFCLAVHAYGRTGFGGTNQEWGLTDIRTDAHMFWWLYYVNPAEKPADFDVYSKPLIIWLQGGPGYGSSGLGNFGEFGPIDLDGKPRSNSWMNDYNVLLIDEPVGSGFSYVDNDDALNKKDSEITEDVVACIKKFLEKFPKFQTVPTYIVGQSYGGKVAANVAWDLYQKKSNGLQINLKGVALGSPAISMIDNIEAYVDYVYYMGLIDDVQREKLTQEQLADIHKAIAADETSEIIRKLGKLMMKLFEYTGPLDYNNIYPKKTIDDERHFNEEENLNKFMNDKVAGVLNVTPNYGSQGAKAYGAVANEMAKPAIETVKKLLTEADLKVTLWGGQFELILPMPGTVAWVNKVFKDDKGWKTAERKPLDVNGVIEGYQKHYGKFSMYWINKSGHRAPADNPTAVNAILKKLTQS